MENDFYINKINSVIDYVEDNLDKKLTLTKLSQVAGISKFHFHRIFKAIIGETLNNYIKRRKMETACKQLLYENDKSLTEIAFDQGYNSGANFSRDFYNYYNQSPLKTRKQKQKPIKREINFSTGLEYEFIGIKIIPQMNVIYSRISTGYNPETIKPSFDKLFYYAMANNLFRSPEQFIGIGYDDPDYTPLSKCRYDTCFVLPENVSAESQMPFNSKTIKQALYAVFCFEGKAEQFFEVWNLIFKEWLINSNYIPQNKPHLEMYLPCSRYMQGYFRANLCLPVKKMK